jgi:hypothetical protein
MSNVNNIKAGANNFGKNTGVGTKWFDLGVPRGFIIVGNGVQYDSTTIATFIAALGLDLLNDNEALRAYPVQNIVEITDGTKKPDIITFAGDGSQVVGGENAYNYTMRWVDGGADLHSAMRKSNRQAVSILIIDAFGQLIGTSAGAAAGKIKGIPAYIYTTPVGMAVTNATVSVYETMISFGASYLNDSRVILDFNSNGGLGYLTSLSGLFNVDIQQAAAQTSTTVTVKAVVIGEGNADMYDLYSAALAVVGAWKVTRVDNGGTLTVSAVAASTTYKGWVLTITAATGLNLNIALAGPTELAALGSPVSGFESNQLVQLMP